MTEDEKSLARESERLRTDQPFAEAVLALSRAAEADLLVAQAKVADAVLEGQPTAPAAAEVIRLRAEIAAINGLATQIAAQILRGTPREPKPVA